MQAIQAILVGHPKGIRNGWLLEFEPHCRLIRLHSKKGEDYFPLYSLSIILGLCTSGSVVHQAYSSIWCCWSHGLKQATFWLDVYIITDLLGSDCYHGSIRIGNVNMKQLKIAGNKDLLHL